uniref:Conserved plasma membrane protein n=1 Tax=Macrostomum lignano TaxID=282301 RepID=A0A1I8IB55_9PLAT
YRDGPGAEEDASRLLPLRQLARDYKAENYRQTDVGICRQTGKRPMSRKRMSEFVPARLDAKDKANLKRRIREKSKRFSIHDGALYYRVTNKDDSQRMRPEDHRRVLFTEEEVRDKIRSLHSQGSHVGVNSTTRLRNSQGRSEGVWQLLFLAAAFALASAGRLHEEFPDTDALDGPGAEEDDLARLLPLRQLARDYKSKRMSEFVGKRMSEFVGKRMSEFVGKRPMSRKRMSEFVGKRMSEFVGKYTG